LRKLIFLFEIEGQRAAVDRNEFAVIRAIVESFGSWKESGALEAETGSKIIRGQGSWPEGEVTKSKRWSTKSDEGVYL